MDTSKIERNKKIFILAYDQGFEHGPSMDFNEFNYNPENIFRIAIEGGATCVTMQYGVAKRFYPSFRNDIPLILKLNAKTKLNSTNYLSAVTGDISDALKLGASGVGFTINPGQKDEHIGFEQFSKIRRMAEKEGLITVLWAYARGAEIHNQFDKDIVAYACRVGGELGADVLKVKYTGNPESFSWVVKNGLGAKVLVSGTDNFDGEYLDSLRKMLTSGAHGIAVGRKVWQNENGIELSKQISDILFNR